MKDLRIEPAGVMDWKRIVAIYHQERKTLADFAIDPYQKAFVAKLYERVIGFASVIPEFCFLHHLYVARSHQGNGVGKALLNHVFKRHRKLAVHVLQENKRAIQFYQREGFTVKDPKVKLRDGVYLLMHKLN